MSKPKLRIIHHLHRTGGTLISKCIASLPGISLLSEINPATPRSLMVLDPLFQANFWLRLISADEARALCDAPFAEKIAFLNERAEARGDTLVIRGWPYLDFFAEPFLQEPSNRLELADTLSNQFELLEVATVRHPMDQWLSWCRYEGSAKAKAFGFERFVDACMRFSDSTRNMEVVKYEDFVSESDRSMRRICELLELKFDPAYARRWPYYHQITGDDNDRIKGGWKIAPRRRREPDQVLVELASRTSAFAALLENYGYG
jgi:hypothetical protein